MYKILLPLIIVNIFLFNCEEKIVSQCEQAVSEQKTDSLTTYEDIQTNIFNPNCISCHAGATPSGGLDLSADVSYENLINVESNNSSYKRVVPCESENSYLYISLEGESAPVMPPSGKLNDARIDSVAALIDRGAIKY